MKALGGYVLIGPLCYQGKADCDYAGCTRTGIGQRDDGTWDLGQCRGYHCSYCDAPCGSQGHRCDAANAVLGASEAALRAEGRIK